LKQATETLAVTTRRGLTEITYVWEHRKRAHRREVVVHVIGS
jgi:hypothetical protein